MGVFLSEARGPQLVALAAVLPLSSFGAQALGQVTSSQAESPGEITVSAPRELNDFPDGSSITVIEADEILGSHLALPEILDRAPGVFIARGAIPGQDSLISIRGASSRQLKVLVDGVPTGSGGGEDSDLTRIPVSWVDRIVVVRGPSATYSGNGAMSGAIHVITKKEARNRARATLGYGSYSTMRADADVSRAWPIGSFQVAAHMTSSEGNFAVKDFRHDSALHDAGFQKHLEWKNNRNFEAGVRANYQTGTGNFPFSLSTSYVRGERGIPGLLGRQFLSVSEKSDGFQGRFGLAGDLTAHVGYQKRDYSDPQGEVTGFPERVIQQSRKIGLNFSPRVELLAEGHAGGSWLNHLALFATLGHESEFFDDSRVLRVRHQQSAATGLEIYMADSRWSVTPSVAVGVATDLPTQSDLGLSSRYQLLEEVALSGNLGTAFRYPTFEELYQSRGIWTGNPSLRPERSLGWDLGLEWSVNDQVTISCRYFQQHYRDLIEYVLSNGFQYKAFNFESVNSEGIELEASVRLSRGVRWSGGITFQSAVYGGERDSGGQSAPAPEGQAIRDRFVPGRPRAYGHTALGFRIFRDARLQTDLAFAAGRYVNRSNSISIPDRLDWGAAIEVEAMRDLKLGIEVKNILDRENSDVRGFPLTGRSVYASVTKVL